MQWFGKHWGAPVCDSAEHVPTPVGKKCAWCGEAIAAGDNGFVIPSSTPEPTYVTPWPSVNERLWGSVFCYHFECNLRQTIGSAAHQLKTCSCYIPGADESDPPELTLRQAARLAVELWEREQAPKGR